MKTVAKKFIQFDGSTWFAIMLTAFVAMVLIFGNNQAQAQQVSPPLVSCNGGYIPQTTPCGSGQQYYGNQPQGNAVNLIPVANTAAAGFSNMSTENLLTLGAAAIGAFNPQGGKGNNRLSTAAEYGALAYLGTRLYDKITEPKPQQVALQQMAPQQSNSLLYEEAGRQHGCRSGMVWDRLYWKGENGQPDHPQHNTFACMNQDDPHRAR